MNITLDTARRLARAADENANSAFKRGFAIASATRYSLVNNVISAEATEARANARRDAVRRLLRRKGFTVEVLPLGFVTIVRAL